MFARKLAQNDIAIDSLNSTQSSYLISFEFQSNEKSCSLAIFGSELVKDQIGGCMFCVIKQPEISENK